MIDRQLQRINGTHGATDSEYPPLDTIPLPVGISATRAINRTRRSGASNDTGDLEEGKYVTTTAVKAGGEPKGKRGSGSGSSESSSNAAPDQAFLPTLMDLPAQPKPASSSGHRRVSSLPAFFR